MRRQQEDAIAGLASRALALTSVQLIGDDGGVLVAEVALLLEQVPDLAAAGLPRQNPIEPCCHPECRARGSIRKPALQDGPVDGQSRWLTASHVQYYVVFINFEQARVAALRQRGRTDCEAQ